MQWKVSLHHKCDLNMSCIVIIIACRAQPIKIRFWTRAKADFSLVTCTYKAKVRFLLKRFIFSSSCVSKFLQWGPSLKLKLEPNLILRSEYEASFCPSIEFNSIGLWTRINTKFCLEPDFNSLCRPWVRIKVNFVLGSRCRARFCPCVEFKTEFVLGPKYRFSLFWVLPETWTYKPKFYPWTRIKVIFHASKLNFRLKLELLRPKFLLLSFLT